MPRKIEISHKTIVFTVLFLVFLWFLYFIKDLILELFVALLIMAIFNPFVTRLTKLKIPRAVAILIVYLLIFAGIGAVVAGVVPPLVEQTTAFANNLPRFLEAAGITLVFSEEVVRQFLAELGSIPAQVLKFSVSVLTNLLGILTVLIFSFYLLLARNKLDDQLGFFFGDHKKKEIGRLIDNLEKRLGGWARGQLFLMLLVGVSTYIGLRLLGIPFALPLALLAFLLEIVPYMGPVLAAIPAVIIGFSISPLMGFATAGLILVIQQIENYVFVPKVMERSVGMSPIIILLSLAIGFRLAGIVGVLVSIPVVITIQVVAKQYFFSKK